MLICINLLKKDLCKVHIKRNLIMIKMKHQPCFIKLVFELVDLMEECHCKCFFTTEFTVNIVVVFVVGVGEISVN